MGSGIFAVPILESLRQDPNIELVGIVTQPDKAAGRKRVLTPTPLGKFADEKSLECVRAESVNTAEFLDSVRRLAPDILVVVSFGQILKEPLLNAPRFGCLNVHASLLPKYRGASPIASAILNGDGVSGVTFMQMEKGLDSGPIYDMFSLWLKPGVTTEMLEQELSSLAACETASCIRGILSGELTPLKQPDSGVSIAVKIKKSDGSVNWKDDAEQIERKIRAYHKWPCMTFRIPLQNRIIHAKITRAACTSWMPENAEPGKFVAYTNNKIMVSCAKGSLLIERILPEGKKEMSVSDFLNGCPLRVGHIFLNGEDTETDHKKENCP